MKEIETLISDIHSLFYNSIPHKIDETNLDLMLSAIRNAVMEAIELPREKKENLLRLSKVGTPDRKLYYEQKYHVVSDGEAEDLDGDVALKFLTGHIIEALLIFLAKEAGHSVEREQEEVDVAGVKGHIDCIIDGHLVDIKTASHFGFRKFLSSSALVNEDPFGYIPQLSAYKFAIKPEKDTCFFWAYNKSSSEMCLTSIPSEALIDPVPRVERQKEVIKNINNIDPKRLPICYEDIPNGKGGNLEISKNCYFCPFKEECRGQKVRKFQYADRQVWLTQVLKTPSVEEIF